METERIMITINATKAYENYVSKGKSPQDNLLYWNEVTKKYYIFDEIQFDENQLYYNEKNKYIKIHLRYSIKYKDNILAYAYIEHIGIFMKEELYVAMVSTEGIGRTMSHEFGHMIDVTPREIKEETNNVLREYSLLMVDINKGDNYLDYNILEKGMTPDNISTLLRGCSSQNKAECNGLFTDYKRYRFLGLIWWEIESYYPGYWGKLNNLYRYNYSVVSKMDKSEQLLYFSSYITGLDLGYFFERIGFLFDNEKKPFNTSDTSLIYTEKMNELLNSGKITNLIQKKFWYIDADEYSYISSNGTGCHYNDYNIEIIDIFWNETYKCYNISLPTINCKGHLDFEIYENNIVVGFSHKNYYLDIEKYPEEYNWSINILMDQIKNVVGVVVYILQLLHHFQELVEYIPQLLHNGARVMEYIPQLHEKIKQILQVLGE